MKNEFFLDYVKYSDVKIDNAQLAAFAAVLSKETLDLAARKLAVTVIFLSESPVRLSG
jgi:hypothetical protein